MMKSAFRCFQIVLLLFGVFGADEDEVKLVMEGDSVTLNPDLTQIKTLYLLEWRFGDPVIAQIDENDISYPSHSEIFRGRLQLDQTGSLTIKNMKTKHSGLYELQIRHSDGTTERKFNVTVYASASVAGKSEKKSVSLMKGDPVTLQTDVTLSGDELIVWRFGEEGKLIAKADKEAKSSPLYDTDEGFRGRLELDQTGSLIITNTSTTDSGLYTVKISSNKQTVNKRFNVTVSVTEPGLSSGDKAWIGVGVVFAAAVVAVAAGFIYFRHQISELRKQISTETVTVKEGEDVTLKPNKAIKKDDKILWMFGEGKQRTPIAELRGEPREIVPHDYAAGGRFRDRLELNKTTGSLTIRNSRIEHSGLYKLQITSSGVVSEQRFILTVKVTETVTVTVKEGEDVTLKHDKAINKDDYILWQFGDEEQLTGIAELKTVPRQIVINDDDYVAGGRFRGRLYLDETTGSLTIRNSRIEHSGLYTLQITSSRGASEQRFILTVKENVEVISVEDGSVTLNPDTEIQRDDLMLWMFGDQDRLIAQIKGGTGEIYDAAADERFRDRLKLNTTTGSLTITDITPEHTGPYKLLTISSKGILCKKFRVFMTYKATGKQQNVSSGKRGNESASVEIPLMNK